SLAIATLGAPGCSSNSQIAFGSSSIWILRARTQTLSTTADCVEQAIYVSDILSATSMAPATSSLPIAERTRRRVTRRLMPFLLVLYIVAYVDRANVAFAGLDMTRDLGFSNKVFGFGIGIFFLGYVLLEIPGTILVELWSARKWIARILISWGLL